MKLNSFKLIQYSLVIIFIWFGVLKILGVSPVGDLVKGTYPIFPEPLFMTVLGIGEVLIGLLLISTKTIKLGIILMWLQLGGIFFGVVLSPTFYFQNMNLLFLSANGEFVVKNLVLLAGSYFLFEQSSKSKAK